ncbi:PKD domain-containing protein [Fulvivirga ligni]|uniref:PKD domain-containing protein n=1 Tax=Fulvivirga ligni TaxID=2904246 RepID=UPI001F380A3D|nr:PKD domain-containing protein [Fulvivirga ligni]UII20232.1 PKD domain-containing protein [Fulvivirga ligni]
MLHSPLRSACLFLILIVSSFSNIFAQSYSDLHWYFGNNNNGFVFIRPDLNPESVSVPNTLGTGMSAVATDPVTGSLLFYTDGVTVYEPSGAVMLGGTLSASATPVSQGIAICAVPGTPDNYYIFTLDFAGNLLATIVDMTAAGNAQFLEPPRGEVMGTTAVPGLSGLSQGFIIVPNDSKDGFWIVSHQVTTANYVTTAITSAGIQTPNPPTAIGAAVSVNNISFNKNTNSLAVAAAAPATDIQIINIDRSTGALTAGLAISGFDGIYDTEWTNSGDYIYASGVFGPKSELVRIDAITSAVEVIPNLNISMSYGLKMAPDSTIYHLYQAPGFTFKVGRINSPDSVLVSQILYEPNAFDVDDYFAQQFPTFLADISPGLTADFTFSGTCQNEETFFYPLIEPRADSVRWNFGDQSSSTTLAPSHTYTEANSYDVTLTAYLNGDSAVSVPQTVPINTFEIQITLRSDTTFCLEDYPRSTYSPVGNGTASVVAEISGSPSSVIWSNDNTGNTLTPDSSGYYYVIATDASGCSTHAGITVNTYGEEKQRSNVWYFGNNAGIDFNSGAAVAIPFGNSSIYNGGNQMIAEEGCAIYCDRNGEPLFYTNGEDVYDSEGNLLTNPDKIGGSTGSTQSSLIVPFPDDETIFYIFTTQEVNFGNGTTFDLQYSVFDLKDESNGTKGAMVRNNNGEIVTKLCSGVTERLTGTEEWVIVHEFGNSNFKAFPIEADGIGSPVISNVGPSHDAPIEALGYMTLSGTGMLAVAYSEGPNSNYVDLLQLVDSTGAINEIGLLDVNNPQDAQSTGYPISGQVYGVCFSPDGSNLFATVQGTPSHLLRWKVDTTTLANTVTPFEYIQDSVRHDIDNSTALLGAMQVGPDGQIYIAADGQQVIPAISNPNIDWDDEITINDFGLDPTSTSAQGLPNFIQNISSPSQGASLTVSGGCFGDQVTLTIENALYLEQYIINVNYEDGSHKLGPVVLTQANNSTTYTPDEPGIYTVTVDITNDCNDDLGSLADQNFIINPLPEFSLSVQAQPSCGLANGSLSINFTEIANKSFTVSGPVPSPSTTVTNSTMLVNNLSAGFYTVTTLDALTGCSDVRSISLNNPTTYTPDDLNVNTDCNDQGGVVNFTFTPASAAPATYRWFIYRQGSNELVASGLESDLPFTNLETDDYYFQIVDLSGCITSGTISTSPPPAIALEIPAEYVACGEEVARIPFTTSSQLSPEVTPSATFEQGSNIILITTPGTYQVTAFGDGINTCDTTATVNVVFPQELPTPYNPRYAICPDEQAPLNQQFVKLPTAPDGFSSVRWFDEDGAEILPNNGGNDYQFTASGDTLIIGVTGRVNFEATNAFGCITEGVINIVQDCEGRVSAPTAFNPSSLNPLNRAWRIFPIMISDEDFQIFIFNRWGEMIFQSSSLDDMQNGEGWNGGYDNDLSRPVPGGTFAYKVEFRSEYEPEKGVQEQRGGITLIR